LFFQLRSHHSIYDEVLELDEKRDEDHMDEVRRSKLTFTESIIAVAISLTFVCMSAVFLVQEIEHVVERGVSDNFIGLILVPLVEKAAEHLVAVDEAWYVNNLFYFLPAAVFHIQSL
jgi:Ca2+:H+ antiporter